MGFTREDTKAIKGIAIILMVYHHLFAFSERAGGEWHSLFTIQGEEFAYWIGDFGKICVALFMFLAGYGTWVSCTDKNDITGIIKEKIKRLYFTYWKVFFVFIPLCMIVGIPKVSREIGFFIKNLFGIRITYVGEWWFFQTYILLLVLFPLLRQILWGGGTHVLDKCSYHMSYLDWGVLGFPFHNDRGKFIPKSAGIF